MIPSQNSSKLLALALFLGALFLSAPTLAASSPAFTSSPDLLPQLVEKVANGVVNISSTKFVKNAFYGPGMDDIFMRYFGLPLEQTQKQSSLGSGFVIDSNGYILTNNHVVEQADEIMILFLDKRKISARIVGRDKALDLALLQLKGSPKNLNPLPLGDSEQVRIGESVFAIGNPFGLQHTVTAGIISAKNRTIGMGAYDRFLQTDCSINFGNSGGPLFNLKGEVIGINTAIHPTGQGLGFAIPSSEAKSHVEEFKRYGRIIRPWLGAMGQNISPALQLYYELSSDTGVVVTTLVRGGPAQKAKLKPGDIIVGFNRNPVKEIYDVQRELASLKPDQTVRLDIIRGERKLEIKVDLSTAPDLDQVPAGLF